MTLIIILIEKPSLPLSKEGFFVLKTELSLG